MTSPAGQVAYDPNDSLQKRFLAALALGETGNASDAYHIGVGGTDLSNAVTSANGFPQWNGRGNSHAAGKYQDQPGTWASVASEFGLNFQNASDQDAGAWYLAQQTYSAATGKSLETALQSGDYSSVQSALSKVWPSVSGNQAAPQGLASDILHGVGATGTSDLTAASDNTAQPESIVQTVEDFFVRFGLIIIGSIVVIVALWQLLSNQGIVPSPADTAKLAAAAL